MGDTLTVIIPTKNRPRDLQVAVASLLQQSQLPAHLLIIDQSDGEESALGVADLFAKASRQTRESFRLCYVRDTTINGLAAARNRAMKIAEGDIWLFLDDDVCLESDFIEQILAVYSRNPAPDGVSGIITNYPHPAKIFRYWSALFVRGPFRDERQGIYWRADQLRNSSPIRVRRFGGGLMSFRRELIGDLQFDEGLRGVCDGEDIDFCSRLRHDALLVIAPRARLVHNQSPAGRLQDHWLRRDVRANLFLFNKLWNRGLANKFFLAWLFAGYGVVGSWASLRRLSGEPWTAFWEGIRDARESGTDRKNSASGGNRGATRPAEEAGRRAS